MNTRSLSAAIILACLCLIVGESYACPPAPPIAVISGASRQYASAGTSKTFNAFGSFDQDEGGCCIEGWYWIVSGCDGYIESGHDSNEMTCVFRTGGSYASVYLKVKDDEQTWSTYDRCYVYVVDLDADTNRDEDITVADETGEDTWSKGPSSRGSIVLPNCDDDNEDGIPDNWPGLHNKYTPDDFNDGDWDLDGTYDSETEGPNQIVDNGNDIDDLAELWFHQLNFRVGYDRKITLEVANASTHSFLTGVPDPNIIRIFLPNEQQNGHWVVTPGATAIIGPEDGKTAEFTYENGLLSMFSGYCKVKFRVEGIEFGAMVDITLKFYYNDVVQASDTVRMKVAPFVLSDHTMDVSSSGKTVYVAKWEDDDPEGNNEVRSALDSKYGSHLDEVSYDPEYDDWYKNDLWHQNAYEVGYVRVPYGSMPVFLVSPRASRERAPPYPINKDLLKYIHRMRLEQNVGVCWRLEGVGDPDDTYNAFGNVESRPIFVSPPVQEPGYFFHGSGLFADVNDFFAAQDVNPALGVSTDWLDIGHVDEVISFAPDGIHTIVADPNVCWALLIWAASEFFSTQIVDGGGDYRYVVNIITDPNLRSYNFETDWATVDLPGIREDLGLKGPVTVTTNPGGKLKTAGAFIGFFPNDNTRYYKVVFKPDGISYDLSYKEEGEENWTPESDAWGFTGSDIYQNFHIDKNTDCIFKDANCFILKHYWSPGTFDVNETFEFEADPTCSTIEMPVLFHNKTGGGATAYTMDHVNCQVDGATVFTADAEETTGEYMNYVTNLFKRAGYSENDIKTPKARFYHQSQGNIYCGTNVRRVIPSGTNWLEWWKCD